MAVSMMPRMFIRVPASRTPLCQRTRQPARSWQVVSRRRRGTRDGRAAGLRATRVVVRGRRSVAVRVEDPSVGPEVDAEVREAERVDPVVPLLPVAWRE